MNFENVKQVVLNKVDDFCLGLIVLFSNFSAEGSHVTVSVFGVPKSKVRELRELLLDLDNLFCAGKGLALTPLIRDIETTERFYPQYAADHSWIGFGRPCLEDWKSQPEHPSLFAVTPEMCPGKALQAANEELALAA